MGTGYNFPTVTPTCRKRQLKGTLDCCHNVIMKTKDLKYFVHEAAKSRFIARRRKTPIYKYI